MYKRSFRSMLLQGILSTILILNVALPAKMFAQVTVKEDSIIIPTYIVEPPNPMPRFYEGRSHQGVQRRIYPYAMNDNLTRIKEDRSYPVIRVENEFIDLEIMPVLGGRIFAAKDKTNNYNWFYRQHVIKPSLIGMVGYWISGANAWGFPHHHGPNTVKSMDYRIEENVDGSKTIWIANTDRRHRMRILIGYTIFPNSSIVEMSIRPMNRTPVVNSFLFWANPSVHVDESYQVIFPPSVQYVTQHAKREMTTWPLADRRYNRFDYKKINISMWKNIGVPSSFFSWNPKEDYFGGYDHGKQAGTVWVGNHHISPGMKFWAWGNNPAGDRANAGLTDNDGHYIELMAGAYTDNQPDYSWIQPYESKDIKMIWFPIRELEGIKYANRNGALNLEVTGKNKLLVRLNTTSPHSQAILLVEAKNKVLLKESINISPAKPYKNDLDITQDISEDDLSISIISADNVLLLSYRPAEHHPPADEIPQSLRSPAAPEKIETVEELYLTGLRLDQFYNASRDPMPYYEEALKRDPNDYRINTQLGIRAIKNMNWDEGEARLRTALKRITRNYTRSRDGEAQYYLGFVLKSQGKLDEAYDQFYNATWSAAWHAPAYFQLAQVDCQKENYDLALNHLNRSISSNTNNFSALNLKAVVLRKLGLYEDALNVLGDILKENVLNHQARFEKLLCLYRLEDMKNAGEEDKVLDSIMGDEVQSYLELAAEYINCGFYTDAVDVLERIEKKRESYPMLYYYLGYCWLKLGEQQKSLNYFKTAAQKPHNYCFPFRTESVYVLNDAMEINPKDALAPYYLGNLYYEHQPQKAIELWQKSAKLNDAFYIVHRNLALAFEEIQNDVSKAIISMEKAVANNSDDPRLLFEMDELYEKNKESSQKKYELLKKNSATAKRRTESILRLATRSVEVGRYDQALDILLNNEFPQFEGGREMQDTYLNALTLRGLNHFNKGEYDPALRDFEMAFSYPVGRFGRSRWAQFHYLLGTVYEKLGNAEKANESYQNCININVEEWGRDQEYNFYRGLAFKKMDKKNEADKVFEDMLNQALSQESNTFFRQFEGGLSWDRRLAANSYLAGLAYTGLGKKDDARIEFTKVLELDPGHVWSKNFLQANKDKFKDVN